MSTNKKLTIGLFGFGVVGKGLHDVLSDSLSIQSTIKKICIKNAEKKRSISSEHFTTDRDLLLEDPEINVIVELIDDADAAYYIVKTALQKGKAVVSANKKLIAEHLPELLELQHKYKTSFLYEAAVCGSIPIIRNLEEYYDNDLLQGICGIVNGSTNFILTQMTEEKVDYNEALCRAQEAGFAESNPKLDVEGIDAVNKLTILLLHGYGICTHPTNLLHIGINRLHASDSRYAADNNLHIKLTAQAKKLKNGKIAAFVLPQLVNSESQLYNVRNEYNGVVLQSSFSDKQFLYGKGAGRYPTASAVLSDISALGYHYQYEYRKYKSRLRSDLTTDFLLKVYVSFDDLDAVEIDDFEWVEPIYSRDKRCALTGLIHFEKLLTATWLNDHTVSIIGLPDAIVENAPAGKHSRKQVSISA